jgi:methane/ammonia monooxygenase subunit B
MKLERLVFALLAFALFVTTAPASLLAHGERNQEPFLRMRTVQWYDVKFPEKREYEVNDTLEVSGKFRIHGDWPQVLEKPGEAAAFLGIAVPGPTFTREALDINGRAVPSSTSDILIGHDYDFRVVMKARRPGAAHIHPMLSIEGSGPIVGPGIDVNVTGSQDDYVKATEVMTGEKIENLETYNLTTVVTWHAFWIAVALSWALYWLARPLLIPRFIMVHNKEWDRLITPTDRKVGVVLLVSVISIVIGAYFYTEFKYPTTIPLQGGKSIVDNKPIDVPKVTVSVDRGEYYVPGRTLTVVMTVTNNADVPVRLGEFMSANLRFVDSSVPAAVAGVDSAYPADYALVGSLKVSDNSPIQPGETRAMEAVASDTAWERERLVGMLRSPDNSFGGLMFFFDDAGNRYIANVGGPILPNFQKASGE